MPSLVVPDMRSIHTSFTILVVIIVGFLLVLAVLSTHALFRLENIEVIGSGAVFSVDAKKLSTNVLFFPTKKLEQDLRTQYPLFQTVRVYKKLPHAIIIEYTLRDPWGYLESAGHTYGVDEQGIIVGEYTPPFVHTVMVFDIGVQSIGMIAADRSVQGALAFLRALDKSVQVSFVKEYSKDAFVASIDSMRVLVSIEDDMEEKARALLFLLNGFRIKGVLPSIVDLRYSKPIITK